MQYCRNCGAINDAENTICYKCRRPLEYNADCEELRAIADRQENILGWLFWLCVIFQPLIALVIGYFLPKNFPKRKGGMIIAGIILFIEIAIGLFKLLS